MRTIGNALTIADIVLLIVGLFLSTTVSEPAVGIIGGADSPIYLAVLRTAAGGLFLTTEIAGVGMTVASLILLLIGRKKKLRRVSAPRSSPTDKYPPTIEQRKGEERSNSRYAAAAERRGKTSASEMVFPSSRKTKDQN